MISVIIATSDDEVRLAFALRALVPAATEGIVREVIIVDSGSRDGTRAVADAAGCTVIEAREGEGLHRAASSAKSSWLLFLSPASVLDDGWQNDAMGFIESALTSGKGRERAATFRLRSLGGGARAKFLEWSGSFRARILAVPSEEQGLLLSKDLYRSLGGHRPLHAMAEADLARRIGRRRLSLLRTRITLHEPRLRPHPLRNAACLALLVLRLPPRLIERLAA